MQRYRAAILIALFGVVPVAAAFVIAILYLKDSPAPPPTDGPGSEEERPAPPANTRDVLGAARALPGGALLKHDDLDAITLEANAVRGAHVPIGEEGVEAAADAWRGHVLRKGLGPGEALLRSNVVGPGESGFLAAVLKPGMRAVTIEVGPATGHAGLIDPGDRVDVILTAELPDEEGRMHEGVLTGVLARTILEDVHVVAVDRRTDNPAPEEGKRRTEMNTATLEVTPEQGDRLVLGGHEGRLALAVRSLTNAAEVPTSVAVDLYELLLPAHAEPLRPLEPLPPPPPPPPEREAGPESEPELVVVRVFRGTEAPENLVFER